MALHVQGVLLDIDGTLLLSNDAHARAWVDAFGEFGYQVPLERVRPLIGMGGDRLIPRLVPGLSEDEDPGALIARCRGEIFLDRYADTLTPAPGSRALVQRIRDERLTTVVASSARQGELDALLRAAGVADLIDVTTTSDEAQASKPAPDIVQVALDKSGISAGAAVMVGDTPYDLESCRNAGVAMIALRCGGHPDSEFAAALAIYDDPADLLAHFSAITAAAI